MDTPPRLADRRASRSPSPSSGVAGQRQAPAFGAAEQPPVPDRAPGSDERLRLWHVSVTFAGVAVEAAELDAALRRLALAQPFLASVRYAADRAEISYWDEAEDVDDAAAMGLRLWAEHRRVADLPDWRPVGLEVADRDTYQARGQRLPAPSGLGDVRPW